jgi:hypothetical protein
MMNLRQRKRLHQFSRIKSISVIGITVLSLGFTAINASAATLDTPETRTISQTATSDKNLPNQIQGFINDVRSFFRGDLFGNITQLVQSRIGSVEVPDLGQVVSQIMTGSFPEDGVTSSKFENNLTNSYAIRLDLANQSERVGAVGTAQAQTMSKAAQDKSKIRLSQSAFSEIESSQMSDDSQNSDTSQQILQNISKQLKNSATIANLQFQEASQARQDRALGLTLTAQAAQELNAANTRERQSAIATGNSAVSQGSLLVMPGGSVLGENSSN